MITLNPKVYAAIQYAVFKCATNCFTEGQEYRNLIKCVKEAVALCMQEIVKELSLNEIIKEKGDILND